MKSYLNTRQLEILSALLKEHNPRTVEELSNSLNIKPRVIQYNLNVIDGWLKTNNTKIIRRSGFGLHIDLTGIQREELIRQLSELEDIELILSTQQRRRCLLIKLVTQEKPISSSMLALEYSVSRTTILNDLLEVETRLKQDHLELQIIPHKGFLVKGNRSVKRFAACLSLCEEHFDTRRSLEDIEKLITSKPPFAYLATEWFNHSDVEFALKTTKKIEGTLKTHYSQATQTGLCYYLLYLLADIRKHQQITDISIHETRFFDEITIFKILKNSIAAYTGEQISDPEMQLLALHLHCQTRFDTHGAGLNSGKAKENDRYLTRSYLNIGHDIGKELSLFLNPLLQIDQHFFNDLSTYLDRCLIYRKYGFSIYNPYSEKIKMLFPDTYGIIESICANYKKHKHFELNKNDVGTLTMITVSGLDRIQEIAQKNLRVALVSSNDHFLTEYTKERVSNNFPWFKMVGVYRKADLNRSSPKNADLILSTVDLDQEIIPSAILIDPFLTELDIQHIQNWINEHAIQKNNNLKEQENVKLSDLLFERNIIFHDKVENWEEAVYLAGEPLVGNKDITHGYLDAIIQINKTYGPYSVVAPNIALLHAKSKEGVNKLCLGLMILKEGVHFGSRKFDPVNILFVIGIPNTHSHLEALHDLINIIRSKGFNENIMNCLSASKAMEIILHHSKQVE